MFDGFGIEWEEKVQIMELQHVCNTWPTPASYEGHRLEMIHILDGIDPENSTNDQTK